MSGVEVAGVILGAIPLVIEAFDHCGRAYDAFATYKEYPREIMKIDSKLGAQRTVFRNSCINLLASLTDDRQRVLDMVTQPSHEMWKDQRRLNEMFSLQTGSLDQTFHSCNRTMEQIHVALQAINRETEGIRSLLRETPTGETSGTREWCRRIGSKIKLSLHKPRIEKRVEELRVFNLDFNFMSNQIQDTLRSLEAKPSRIKPELSGDLAKYLSIREASLKLHDTLLSRWRCPNHTKHFAHISFGLGAVDIDTIVLPAPVRLKIAVTYRRQDSTSDPIWLSVESSTDMFGAGADVSVAESLTQFTKVLQIHTEQASTSTHNSRERPPEARRLVIPSPMPCVQSIASVEGNPNVPDLCRVANFCSHFERRQNRPEQVCLGFFKDTRTQRFYHSSAEDLASGSPYSLAEVITWINEDSIIRSLPRDVIIALAASMSAAILQYYSTPWMSESWQSRDVWFFGTGELQQQMPSLKSPHLYVDISQGEGNDRPCKGYVRDSASDGARNELLFRLGIMLLELGFAKPWSVLRDMASRAWPGLTEYRTAEKFGRSLVNSMGPQYSKITLQCLGCDFGLGESDFSSEELQRVSLTDVVIALQRLHHRFSQFSSI